jgi:hypothetical protein
VFSNRIGTDEERKANCCNSKVTTLIAFKKVVKNQDKQLSEIDKLQRQGKRKNNLIQGSAKCKRFIQQQKKQDEMMKEFAKEDEGQFG